MGRGGGHHGSSHHSSFHSSHHRSYHSSRSRYRSRNRSYHSSYSGDGGSSNPRDIKFDIICLVIASICLLVLVASLALVIVFADKDVDDGCTDVETLNRNEQVMCLPKNCQPQFFVTYESAGKGHAHVYRTNINELSPVTRSYTWLDYHEKIKKNSYTYFSVSASPRVSVDVNVKFDEESDDLSMYWFTYNQFTYFMEGDYYKPVMKSFKKGNNRWNKTASGNQPYYLVFSTKDHSVKFSYDVALEYTVYDVSKMQEVACSGRRCEVNNMVENEDVIIVDYPVQSTSASQDNPGKDPEYFGVRFVVVETDEEQIVNGSIFLGVGTFMALCWFIFMACGTKSDYDHNRSLKKQAEKELAESRAKEAKEQQQAQGQQTEVPVYTMPALTPYADNGITPGASLAAGEPPSYAAGSVDAPPSYVANTENVPSYPTNPDGVDPSCPESAV